VPDGLYSDIHWLFQPRDRRQQYRQSRLLLCAHRLAGASVHRHTECRHRGPTRRIAQFGITREIAEQDDFVEACHTPGLLSELLRDGYSLSSSIASSSVTVTAVSNRRVLPFRPLSSMNHAVGSALHHAHGKARHGVRHGDDHPDLPHGRHRQGYA